MPKTRLALITLAIIMAALGTIVFAPFIVSTGLKLWLHWQARRQQLTIDIGKISAPFLRPVSIDRLHIASEKGAATGIDINAEGAVLHLRLAQILTGRSDGIRVMSIQNTRAEIRRDFAETRPAHFNWGALQMILPTNFDIAHLDLRVENGPTVILVHNATISGNQIESGRCSADEFTITSPMFRQTFSQLRGATKWQEARLTIGGLTLARGVDLQSFTVDLSRLNQRRADLQFDLDVFGGKIRANISNEWGGQHSIWNVAGNGSGISLTQTSDAFGFTDRLGGSLRACNFTFRGEPRDPMSGTASIWTELNGLTWHNRAADVIMLGAIFYNRQIQLQQLYIKQRKNELSMSGEGVIPSKSSDWLNPDFRGQILGKITDLGQLAELFGANPHEFAGAVAIEGTLNARERKVGGFLTATGSSLSFFKRQIDKLSAKINLKPDALELEELELTRKKDFIRAQGKIDISREHDYSGTIDAKVADAAEYFPLERAGAKAPITVQLNAQVASSAWDAHGAFTLPGSSAVEFAAKFPLKIGEDWKTFLASPIEATINFPAVVLTSAPQFFHPAIFNEGILSGNISLSQNLEHPNLTGEAQLLNGVLQNAPLDLIRASGRMTFAGDHGTLEFFNAAATKDVDLSMRGDVDFRSSHDVITKLATTTPIFDTTTSVQECVRRIEVAPVDVTLAPTVQEVELRGDLFGGGAWKLNLKESATTSPAAAIANPLTREFHFCTGDTPPGEVFIFGIHPRPQPTTPKTRKRARH